MGEDREGSAGDGERRFRGRETVEERRGWTAADGEVEEGSG